MHCQGTAVTRNGLVEHRYCTAEHGNGFEQHWEGNVQ